MKNLKPAWKLFFTFIKQANAKWVVVLFMLISIAVMVLVGIEGEVIGNGEHLLSMSFTCFSYYTTFFGLFLMLVNLTNNRFFISCPEAKRVFTRVLPVLSVIIDIILLAISVTSAVICGHTPQMISDALIFNAIGIAISTISISLAASTYGFTVLYIGFIPWTILVFTVDNPGSEFLINLHCNGFGIPMEISAVICAVSIIAAFACSFRLAEFCYKKRAVRLMNAAASFVTTK